MATDQRKRRTARLPHPSRTIGDPTIRDSGRWWEVDGDDGVAQARSIAQRLRGIHYRRRLQDDYYTAVYEGKPPVWLTTVSPASQAVTQSVFTLSNAYSKAKTNLVRRCVDTARSMLTRTPTEVRTTTSGASWKLQKRAKERQKFVNGLLRELGWHEMQKLCFLDGARSVAGGCPLFSVDIEEKKIVLERLHPSSVLWNDYDPGNSEITNLHVIRPVQRSVLFGRYPSMRDEIERADRGADPFELNYRRVFGARDLDDQAEVYEAWHLGPNRSGRHVVSVSTGTLLDEEWELGMFPIPRFCWSAADVGWANNPAVDQLIGYHNQVNRELRKIDRVHSLFCLPRVFLEDTGDTEEDELTNEIGVVGHFRGTPPTFAPAMALPPQFYQWVDWYMQQGLADMGLNDYQSKGTIPLGMQDASGKALRELADNGSSRQIDAQQKLEAQTVRAGEIAFRLAAKLAAVAPDFAVNALGARSYERISWKDVAGDEDDIRFVSTPASALPQNTAAKIQTVTDIIKSGLLPPEEVQGGLGLQLLNFPDLEKVVTMETANRELVEMQVDSALYDGVYFAPEPYQSGYGLKLLKTMAFRAYAQALQLDGVPPRNMDMLRRLMSEADMLEQRLVAAKQPQIQQPMGAVQPPAAPPLEQSPMAPPPMPPMPAAGGPQ